MMNDRRLNEEIGGWAVEGVTALRSSRAGTGPGLLAGRTDAGLDLRENQPNLGRAGHARVGVSGMRTARSNKGLKLTRPEHIGASQLNPGVRPLHAGGTLS